MCQFLKYVMFALIFVAQIASANGDPVMRYSSINRVANPEPLDVSEIIIEKELLKITREDAYNCFEVTYYLKNTSDVDFPELHYGFPIDYLVEDENEIFKVTDDWLTESSYETGWNEKLIKDVSFRLDGKELLFDVSKESVELPHVILDCNEDSTMCDTIPEDGINRRWFYTQLSIAPKSKAVLQVSYKVNATGNSPKGFWSTRCFYERKRDENETGVFDSTFFNRYLSSNFRIIYDFSPAKHFGNNGRYQLDVLIDLSNLNDPYIINDGSDDPGYKYSATKVRYRGWGSADSFKPINLYVYYEFDFSKENIDRTIDKLKYADADYKIKYSKDKISIDFPTPRFVSEIACDMDTTLIRNFEADITYQSGRREHSTYSSYYWRYGERPTLPISLIVITDVADRHYWAFSEDEQAYNEGLNDLNSDDFRIKNITFTFPEGLSPKKSPAMSNIRPLDSRFDKP